MNIKRSYGLTKLQEKRSYGLTKLQEKSFWKSEVFEQNVTDSFPQRISPSDNFPNVQFPKQQLPTG